MLRHPDTAAVFGFNPIAGGKEAGPHSPGALVPWQVSPPGLATGTGCENSRNVPSASSPPPVCACRAFCARTGPAEMVCGFSRARAPTDTQRPGGCPAGTALCPGVSPDGGGSDKWHIPEPGWNKEAGLGKAAGMRHPGGEGRERERGHRTPIGANLEPQVGKAAGAGRESRSRRGPRLRPAK